MNTPQPPIDPVSGPDGDSRGDQDIDTAGTEADVESPTAAGASSRKRGRPDDPDASVSDRTPARPVIDRHR